MRANARDIQEKDRTTGACADRRVGLSVVCETKHNPSHTDSHTLALLLNPRALGLTLSQELCAV